MKKAIDLEPFDKIDLEGDPYATRVDEDASMTEQEAHAMTISMFEMEYAMVESVERETPECVVVHTSLTSFGCPPDHKLKTV